MSVHVHAYVYVCASMRVYAHVQLYVYLYMCVCICIYVCIYTYIHTRVGVHMHSSWRILFICAVQSLYYMRVSQVFFQHLHARVRGDWKWGFFPAWLALVPSVGVYVLAGVDIRVFPCIFLYFGGC